MKLKSLKLLSYASMVALMGLTPTVYAQDSADEEALGLGVSSVEIEETTESALETFVSQTVMLTNQERRKFGLQPLAVNPQLARAAQAHAIDMANRNFFDHTNLSGQSPFQRMNAAGYAGRFMGENIAAGQKTPEAVVLAWMKSPGHRKNMLSPNYNEIGIGFVTSSSTKFKTYWVQNFGKR